MPSLIVVGPLLFAATLTLPCPSRAEELAATATEFQRRLRFSPSGVATPSDKMPAEAHSRPNQD